MAKPSPAEFARQVRSETSKVVWPTPRETTVTSFMVFIMVVITAVFFVGVDFVLNFVVQFILGVGA